MKKNIIAITITLLVVTAGALTLVQCDQSNMARVTIHIQNDLYAQKSESIIDKILNIFSSNLYAGAGWSSIVDSLTLYVTGPSISTIVTEIPPTAETFTIDIPAGAERTFTLFSKAPTGFGAVETNWGGRITEFIEPGDNSLIIDMIPMTKISGVFSNAPAALTIRVEWEEVSDVTVTINGYNVYRALEPDGDYDHIGTTTGTTLTDPNVDGGTTYYYKVSVIGSNDKEGLLCEYGSGSL